ncbi:MAG TPA: Asp-tRNA(Asn)/Glu-tRNA(Gln) amidotransferase subunit GatA [Fibrobacteria bacterium]|nr:Asp-tRNA(Asn)/Glu-tRNA(Gln) amidotransferase subunit GatA [Fibrobacteria bacterium]HOX53265.1 Asp-tRNA(Asn)/Glu-tRNA(Gln) amidotransferase subunit GatA [Fibrobacteria bacterium]
MSTPSLHGTRERLSQGESSESLVSKAIAAAKASSNGAFNTVEETRSLERARQVDLDRRSGKPLGPLAGIPVAIKDNICTQGLRTTCGSRILDTFVPPYSATAVERLEAAGAIVVGKTAMDEFGMGSTSESNAFGVVRNPSDPTRTPGGSSGGSAVAVAEGVVPVSLGSDTGGSIRLPASFCGVVGLKPTYGRVSRYGLIAYASSLDQIGPFATNVSDVAEILGLIAGADDRDNTSARLEVPDFSAALEQGVKGLRVGIPAEYWGEGLDPQVKVSLENGVRRLSDAGATVVPVSLPSTKYAVSAYYIIAMAEASSNLSRFDGVRYTERALDTKSLLEMYSRTRSELFGQEVQRRILLGTFVLSSGYYDAYYSKAQRIRELIRREFQDAFRQCDLLAAPTAPTTAWKLGEKLEDPLAMYLSDIDTIAVNLAGLPGMVVPVSPVDGLPVGLQLIAPAFHEATLVRAGRALERAGD